MSLHRMLDWEYGPDGDAQLRAQLKAGASVREIAGELKETPLHVAVRRRRQSAVEILLEFGAPIDAKNIGHKTAWTHARRRGFTEITRVLEAAGASLHLDPADHFALAVSRGDLPAARGILEEFPDCAKTGNPEEDRLVADMAGRDAGEPVEFLIEAGADLGAKALDGGTALHQAAWFGQPANARCLVAAGAELEGFDNDHKSSPLHWAVHGSRYSGGAEERQALYVELVELLLEAGSKLRYPGETDGDHYWQRLVDDATPKILPLLEAARK